MPDNVFTLIKSMSYDKKDHNTEEINSLYNAFVVNKNFSYFPDTVMYANLMNRYQLDSKMGFDFYINIIKPRNRFAKWVKNKSVNIENLDLVKEHFNYSNEKALAALQILSSQDIENIKEKKETGGAKIK